jgi:hypothetical protein
MKHQQHSSPAPKSPIPATPRARAASGRTSRALGPHTDESADSRDRAIRETAYAFYEARGRADGHELEDWFQAEAEVDRGAVADPVESIGASQPEP